MTRNAMNPPWRDRVEGYEALRLLAELSPEDQAAFADWCQTMSAPMDDAHLPALLETWRTWERPKLQPREDLG